MFSFNKALIFFETMHVIISENFITDIILYKIVKQFNEIHAICILMNTD
jgi:hypothetical protein